MCKYASEQQQKWLMIKNDMKKENMRTMLFSLWSSRNYACKCSVRAISNGRLFDIISTSFRPFAYPTDLRFHRSIVVSFLVCSVARICHVLGSHTCMRLCQCPWYLSFVWFYVLRVGICVLYGAFFIELIMLITSDGMIEAYFQFNILIQHIL